MIKTVCIYVTQASEFLTSVIAIQVIGCVVEIHDEVKFVGNKAKHGGALYIVSLGQIKMFPDSALTFENNEGR